ncbi:DUF4236 domain-containing protein [Tenacibaculum sp. MAR_2010_89]|uniref:DUF4236 domain-containing protein n=1 Tax=Tenacibaculum TaxID=104267 RepID=UPI00089C5421|nr:DUF4236 domain-containing protein [Tenacibaculum sp. MAR_2010_89]SEE49897.1 Protein of unknown function [Tenacibaculum sp. MAR_2010_89]
MGLQFYRRLKLGKGLGLNISKSGISPSLRTKIGAVSSKGYSIKTGIKGLNYRKYYSKKEAIGCFGIVFTIISVFIALLTKRK